MNNSGLDGEKKRFFKSFVVQHAETAVSFVKQKNGVGIISEFVLNVIPNKLKKTPITPMIEIDYGLIAHDLNDLTPVAVTLMNMVKAECAQYC